ncbi:uncharacterized protein [Diabrotica undecimpunctata]|uniref:uncharacterized protein n=1 Tax=Diabrotica undecimpunctata TaxID=50387 RepID=UPI003B63C9D6
MAEYEQKTGKICFPSMLNYLHNNYKICEKHFEPVYMSKGNKRKTLFGQAHPTIFSHSQYSQHTDEPLKKVIRLEGRGITEVDNVQPVAIKNPTDDKHSIPDTLMEEFLVTDVDVNRQEVSTRSHTPQCFTPYAQSAATQTSSKLSGGTPWKCKMRLKIKTLRANVKKACTSSKKKEDDKTYLNFIKCVTSY